jgi:predicted metal-dependent phosphoesterase TrpH
MAIIGKADFHIHSLHSDGKEGVAHIVAHVEQHTDLDVIAIADHDNIDGALLARDMAATDCQRLQVLPAAEISTREGHLLALGIEKLIPAKLSMAETILAVREQGGVAIVAHPLCRWCPSASLDTLRNLAQTCPPDGLEVLNGSLAGLGRKGHLQRLNDEEGFHWAEAGGSDAHTLNAIGSAYTSFKGHTAADLLSSLRAGTTEALGGAWPLSAFALYGVHKITG